MQLSAYIENTLLKAEATSDDIQRLCAESIALKFRGVCINPRYIPLCKHLLANSGVAIVTVVGFPLGANATAAKAFEAEQAIRDGAGEIDMVIAVGAIKQGDLAYAEEDIRTVVKAAGKIPVKVIIETSLLSTEEKIAACKVSARAGASFVKTSTGFGGGGATIDDILLMRANVPKEMGIKASGGVKTTQQAMDLIAAGATRLGTSSGKAIVTGSASSSGAY